MRVSATRSGTIRDIIIVLVSLPDSTRLVPPAHRQEKKGLKAPLVELQYYRRPCLRNHPALSRATGNFFALLPIAPAVSTGQNNQSIFFLEIPIIPITTALKGRP